MELIDTHCHIQSVGQPDGEEMTRALWAKAKETTPEAVITRAEAADVRRMVCVGCHLKDSQLAAAFAAAHAQCWASVGVHPHEAQRVGMEEARTEIAALVRRPKVIAIGECGLDYFYEYSPKDRQRDVLRLQLEVAHEYNMPLIFHVREAFDDFWPIFESYHSAAHPVRGVLHSFTDSQANLERALQYGLFIGVNGIATFTKNPAQQAVYRTLPLSRLLLETDAPFLTPHPYRGTICEPYHIRTIAEYLSDVRSEPLESLAKATTDNARSLFGI